MKCSYCHQLIPDGQPHPLEACPAVRFALDPKFGFDKSKSRQPTGRSGDGKGWRVAFERKDRRKYRIGGNPMKNVKR